MSDDLFATIGPWVQSSLVLWGPLVVWPVVLLTGEGGAIVAFAFAAQGYLDPASAIVFAFLGSFSADLFWYYATTGAIKPWFIRRAAEKPLDEEKSRAFIGLVENHPYILLIILKFLMGIRLMLTIYILTKKKINLKAYFLCTLLGNLLFITILFPVGWLLGKGLGESLFLQKNISGTITVILVVGIGSQIVFRIIRKSILYFNTSRNDKRDVE
ncbi:MAG: VTT domain-containing protein [Candidatus Moranbacteria bacterium]|nr:VTT domain-containing protein [Candidatus Moranbacteria bacterium]